MSSGAHLWEARKHRGAPGVLGQDNHQLIGDGAAVSPVPLWLVDDVIHEKSHSPPQKKSGRNK